MNILRRLSRGGETERQIEFGDLVINHVTHEVRIEGAAFGIDSGFLNFMDISQQS